MYPPIPTGLSREKHVARLSLKSPQRILTDSGLLVRHEGGLLVVEGVTDGAEITRRLAVHDLFVSELTPVRADLESVFLELTADEGLERAGVAR
jgi:hypothetical protein